MSEKHLKSHQHYIDLYDRGTVEVCRRLDKPSTEFDKEELKEKRKKLQELPKLPDNLDVNVV